ncbi:MAG: zinc ribbon domain-containing protein [Fidelibacterota bacterium]
MNVWVLFMIFSGTLLYVGYPFFKRVKENALPLSEKETLFHLYTGRDTLIRALKDLEFDFQMGRISEDDFREGNSWYRREAADVLREIDSLEGDGRAQCPSCGAGVSKRDRFCARCGSRLGPRKLPGPEDPDGLKGESS